MNKVGVVLFTESVIYTPGQKNPPAEIAHFHLKIAFSP